jgi:FkbM family methyltransferase
MVEAVIGRDLCWRIGRFLYLGARRELGNDATSNGEYALIGWVAARIAQQRHGVIAGKPVKVSIVDIGANVGDWTERALHELESLGIGDNTCIHAFEPAPDQNAYLRNRLASAVADGRVQVHAEAVGATRAIAKFTVTGSRAGTSALFAGAPAGGDQIDVEVLTLDDVTTRAGLDEIVLVKIDTEGNDFNVIRGGSNLLRDGRVLVVQFEYNWRWVGFGHCLRSVFGAIENTSYVFGRLTQDGIEVHEEWHPELEHYFETNYVLVRRDVLPFLPHTPVMFGVSSTVRPA